MGQVITLKPNKRQVGIVVRFKNSPDAEPIDQGHVDAILPGGKPVGFYGAGLFRAQGVVMDYPIVASRRPEYVDTGSARSKPCVSTVLLLNTGFTAASIVESFWQILKTSDSMYNVYGANCASCAAAAFEAAGIMDDQISGLDTPNNLYKHLLRLPGGTMVPVSGYVGFKPLTNGDFEIVVEKAA